MTAAARIVVGVDGSPASVAALRWALGQAALTSARVEAVTCWRTPTQYGYEMVTAPVDWIDLAQRTLDVALKEAGDGGPVDVDPTVRQGHPAQVLVAASDGAQLLVVGSRGHGGFAGMLLGSVSDYVIAHAACPVLVVRAPSSSAPVGPHAMAD